MTKYEYYVSSRVMFGAGRTREIGLILKQYNQHGNIMLVTDSGGWVEPLIKELEISLYQEGFKSIVKYNAISPNPKMSECIRGIEIAKENKSSIFIALGGGSILDAAKKIAKDCEAKFFITIPTTAGTGSHINEWSVLIKDENSEKISLQNIPANIALLDPIATVSMPPVTTLFTGLDSFSHGMEAYFGTGASILTDMQSLKGCQMVVENIQSAMEDGNNIEVRSRILEADLLTGNAMLNAGLGILHCIANIVPGFYPDYSHGYICASLLKATAEFNKEAISQEKRQQMLPLVEKISNIFENAIKKYDIKPVTIDNGHLQTIKKIGAANVNGKTNPKKVTEDAVEKLMRDSFLIT
ncbi:MAG: hypothetical protein APF76_08675 [Desulfitibacter sp. BRH_c19]|nr:MAG: hypothetical protein APF76_08675 [Desulfitibacter sp. BRH_c19]